MNPSIRRGPCSGGFVRRGISRLLVAGLRTRASRTFSCRPAGLSGVGSSSLPLDRPLAAVAVCETAPDPAPVAGASQGAAKRIATFRHSRVSTFHPEMETRRRGVFGAAAAIALWLATASPSYPQEKYEISLRDMVTTLSRYDVVHTRTDVPYGGACETIDYDRHRIEISTRWGIDETTRCVIRAFFRTKYPDIPEDLLAGTTDAFKRAVYDELQAKRSALETHPARRFFHEVSLSFDTEEVVAILAGFTPVGTSGVIYYDVEHRVSLEDMRSEADISKSELGVILGLIDLKKRKIYLAEQKSARLRFDRPMEQTVIHESLHGVEHMAGIEYSKLPTDERRERNREIDRQATEVYRRIFEWRAANPPEATRPSLYGRR